MARAAKRGEGVFELGNLRSLDELAMRTLWFISSSA
jgi:hypothetical protein